MIASHPGGQKKLCRFSWLFAIIATMATIFLCLTIYNVIKDNIKPTSAYYTCFNYVIVDTKTTCTAFLTLVGLLLARHHFVIGYRPIIAYQSLMSKSSSHPNFNNCTVWQVNLKNVGLGPAVFTDFQFSGQINGTSSTKNGMNFIDTEHWLQQNGFVSDKDFSLWTISKGGTLPSKEQLVIFELKLPSTIKLDQLDILVTFKGVIGGTYQKEVYLIPRLGLPNLS